MRKCRTFYLSSGNRKDKLGRKIFFLEKMSKVSYLCQWDCSRFCMASQTWNIQWEGIEFCAWHLGTIRRGFGWARWRCWHSSPVKTMDNRSRLSRKKPRLLASAFWPCLGSFLSYLSCSISSFSALQIQNSICEMNSSSGRKADPPPTDYRNPQGHQGHSRHA